MAWSRILLAAGTTAALALLAAASASAQDYKARAWAASCATCHSTGGANVRRIPPLAGRPKADLVAALGEFKHGGRKGATVMHQYVNGYSDAQLERIAEQLAQQSR